MKFLSTSKHLRASSLLRQSMSKTSSAAKILIVVMPLLTCSQSFAGPVTTGGGNTISARIEALQKMFGSNDDGVTDQTINKVIANMASTLNLFPPKNDTAAMKDLATMIAGGLENDIMKTHYVLSSYCSVIDDRTGKEVEKSASTQKINLIENPNLPHPDICINVQNIATNNSSLEEIKGLLFHEHARHFGLEDTTPLKVNPIALAITKMAGKIKKVQDNWSTYLYRVGTSGIKLTPYFNGNDPVDDRITSMYIDTLAPEKVIIGLRNISSACNKGGFVVSHQSVDTTDIDNGDYYISARYINRELFGDFSESGTYDVQLNSGEAEISYDFYSKRSLRKINGNLEVTGKDIEPTLIQASGWGSRPTKGLERLQGKEMISYPHCQGTLDVKFENQLLGSYKVEFDAAYDFRPEKSFQIVIRGTKPFSYSYEE